MTVDQLKQIVGDEKWPEVVALLKAIHNAGYVKGVAEDSPVMKTLKALYKAWTIWLAGAVATWPLYEAQLTPLLVSIFGEKWQSVLPPILGLAFGGLRLKTHLQSNKSKE